MKKLFAILAILGIMSVGLPSVLLAQDSTAAQTEEVTAPAVTEEAAPVAVTLELRQLVKFLENNSFFEEVIEIDVDGKVESVKIQALQRHPAKNTPMHADFKRA